MKHGIWKEETGKETLQADESIKVPGILFFFLTEVGNQQFLPYNDHIYLEILFIDEPKNKNIEM